MLDSRLGSQTQSPARVALLRLLLLGVVCALAPSCTSFGDQYQDQKDVDTFLEWSNYWYFKGSEDRVAYQRAMLNATKVLEQDPNNVMAKNILGYSLLKLGPWDSENPRIVTARSVFNDLITNYPENYRAHMGLGICYYKLASAEKDSEGRPGYGKLLTVFERAMEAAQTQRALVDEARQLEVGDAARAKKERELFNAHQSFANDLSKLVMRRYFPAELYRELVAQNRGGATDGNSNDAGLQDRDPNREFELPDIYDNVDMTERGPTPTEINDALGARLQELIRAQENAIAYVPGDLDTFVANMNRIEVLLDVAIKHYRKGYERFIDVAIASFDDCRALDPAGAWFWVQEYRWYSLQLKASLYPSEPRTEANPHWTNLQAAAVAVDDFLQRDMRYEQARMQRINSEGVKELEDNPWIEGAVTNYYDIMYDLINQARLSRQRVISAYVSLLANKFKAYDDALHWCDMHEQAEVLWKVNRDPFVFHYLKGQVYNANRDKLIHDYEVRYGQPLPQRIPPPEGEQGDRGSGFPGGTVVDREDHGAPLPLDEDRYAAERTVYGLARAAYAEFRQFMKKSSVANEGDTRREVLTLIEDYERTYPGIQRDLPTPR